MAKVTIVIEDSPEAEGGNVKLEMTFDPEIREGEYATPAQNFAFNVIQAAQEGLDAKKVVIE